MAKASNTESQSNEPDLVEQKLQTACKEARSLLTQAESTGVPARYRAAVIIRDVMESGAYGKGAVRQMQKSLGFNQKSLYRFACVARAWTRPEFETLSIRKDRNGEPLTWSAWLLLAGIESFEHRAAMTDRAFAEAMTIRELQAALKPTAVAEPGAVPSQPVHKVVSEVRRRVTNLDKELRFWGADFLPLVGRARQELAEPELAELRQVGEYLASLAPFLAGLAPQLLPLLGNGSTAIAPVQTLYSASPGAQAASV